MSWEAQTASIEETLALWAASLREIKQRIRPLFTQERVATNAGLFVEGLLGDEQRKTGWMRAEAAGDPGPWRQQAILGRGDWDADALRDIVRDYVLEHLADDDAVLVIDETGFLKQGKASCGVARQYTGSAGTILSTVLAISNSNYAKQVKDMYSGSAALMSSIPGASDRRSPGRLPTSPGRGPHPTGSACRREPGPKDRGCTIGVISNWPILRPGSSTLQMTVCGHAVY